MGNPTETVEETTSDPLEGFQRPEGFDPLGNSPSPFEEHVYALEDGKDPNNPEPAPEAPEAPAEATSVIKIGDKDYSVEEIAETIAKRDSFQSDYTRKTQELATERAQYEAIKRDPIGLVKASIDALPDHQKQQALSEFAGSMGYTVQPLQGADDQIEWSSDGERALAQQNRALQAQILQMSTALNKVSEFIGEQQSSSQTLANAKAAAATIKADTGHDIDPSEIIGLMKETGISDGVSAFWAKRGKQIAEGARQAATPKAKPNTPSTGANSFDPFAQDDQGNYLYSAAQLQAMRDKGMVPTRTRL